MNNTLYSHLFPGDVLKAHSHGWWNGFKLNRGEIIFIISQTDQLTSDSFGEYYQHFLHILVNGAVYLISKRRNESYSYMLEKI